MMREATLSKVLLGVPLLFGIGAVTWLVYAPAASGTDLDLVRAEQPESVKEPPRAETFAQLRRRVKARIARLGKQLPRPLTIVEALPFLVIGDETDERARYHVKSNIVWADRHLRQLYFARKPRPLEVWLASSPARYIQMTQALVGAPPTTPYGYYLGEQRLMVMNIQTGGGTLVHELVHAYMEANFPGCPPWFNEGLGSLYEMVGEKKGRLWGFVNWRLPGLQQAIASGKLRSFEKLTALTARQFYGEGSGVHYAQSRYLLYYLQIQSKLVAFYRQFHKNRRTDPTGIQTLRSVLGEPDLQRFRRRWRAWVLKLRYAPQALITIEDAAVKTGDPKRDPPPRLP